MNWIQCVHNDRRRSIHVSISMLVVSLWRKWCSPIFTTTARSAQQHSITLWLREVSLCGPICTCVDGIHLVCVILRTMHFAFVDAIQVIQEEEKSFQMQSSLISFYFIWVCLLHRVVWINLTKRQIDSSIHNLLALWYMLYYFAYSTDTSPLTWFLVFHFSLLRTYPPLVACIICIACSTWRSLPLEAFSSSFIGSRSLF